MDRPRQLALFGGKPMFERPISCGQRYFPSLSQYKSIFHDIFERQYYTNHGPLAQQLEKRLAAQLAVRHAMCVTNGFIGLALAGQALRVHGNVVVPAHSGVATARSLQWTDARALFCDIDPTTGLMTAETVAPLLSGNAVSAILAVNPWGDACDVGGLQRLADRYRIPLYFDSAHSFGCAIAERPIGSFGSLEVISFHSDDVVGACEGGVVCTQSDELAAHIRNIRSNYGMGAPVPVVKTSNGRMSEAQAAIALFNVDHFAEHRHRNEHFLSIFNRGIERVPGLVVRPLSGVSQSNYQNLICLVDEMTFGISRDDLCQILRAENILAGKGFGAPSSRHLSNGPSGSPAALPNTESYGARTIELPAGADISEFEMGQLLDLLRIIQSDVDAIREQLAAAA